MRQDALTKQQHEGQNKCIYLFIDIFKSPMEIRLKVPH